MIVSKINWIQILFFFSVSQSVKSSLLEDLLKQFKDKNINILAPQSLTDNEIRTISLDRIATCTTTVEIKCNDCVSQMVCTGTVNGNVVMCPEEYPYCDPIGMACSTTPSAACQPNKPSDSLTCSGPGYFPAPDDCSKYYVCDRIGSKPSAYQCPSKWVYDPNLERCKTKRLSRDCSILKCDLMSPSPVVVHPVYPQYFGLCNTNSVLSNTAVAVLKCANNFVFNTKTYRCEFKCRRSGYFQGSQKNKFVVCYKMDKKFSYVEESCPPGFNFDETVGNCQRIVPGIQT